MAYDVCQSNDGWSLKTGWLRVYHHILLTGGVHSHERRGDFDNVTSGINPLTYLTRGFYLCSWN